MKQDAQIQQGFAGQMGAVQSFRDRVFGSQAPTRMEAYFNQAAGKDLGPVYGSQGGGIRYATDPSWSPSKRAAFQNLYTWAPDMDSQPMPQGLYGYLQEQRGNADAARLLAGVDPKTRMLRPMTPEERRKLFLGG